MSCFTINAKVVNILVARPKGNNDRLMTVRRPLPRKKFAALISSYALTMTILAVSKNRFYENLNDTISAVTRGDKLIIFGEFNAHVFRDHVIGRSNEKIRCVQV